MMTGTMSYMTVVRLVEGPVDAAGHWWLLGLAWVPALAVAAVDRAAPRGRATCADLFRKSAALVLVFFLARTWLAEPNVVLVLALVLVLASLGDLDRRFFTAIWVDRPRVHGPQRLAAPAAVRRVPARDGDALAFVGRYGDATLLARAALVVAWQVAGWWAVVACLRRRPA